MGNPKETGPHSNNRARSAKVRVWSLVATVVLGSFATTVLAQGQPAANSQQITVAVVDVGHILKNHPTMKSEIETIVTRIRDSLV